MKCNMKCPFFFIKNKGNYISVFCKLEDQETICDIFWNNSEEMRNRTKDKKCHIEKERILQMKLLLGELDEM